MIRLALISFIGFQVFVSYNLTRLSVHAQLGKNKRRKGEIGTNRSRKKENKRRAKRTTNLAQHSYKPFHHENIVHKKSGDHIGKEEIHIWVNVVVKRVFCLEQTKDICGIFPSKRRRKGERVRVK